MNKSMYRQMLAFASALACVALSAPLAAQDAPAEEQEADEQQAQVETTVSGEPAGVDVSFGPLVVSRSLQMSLDSKTSTHDPQLYLGGTLRLRAELVELDSVGARLSLEGEGGYAASRNRTEAPELSRQPVTEASFLHARLAVRRPLSQTLHLDVGVGMALDSFIVEPNLTYTGHRYVSADVRAALGWHSASGGLSVATDVSALPTLSVNQSSGIHGESSAFGVRLGAQLGYDVLAVPTDDGYRGGQLLVRYDYSRFRTQFPEARLGIGDGVSLDQAHALVLMFGYVL